MARKRTRLHGSPEQHRAAAERTERGAMSALKDAVTLAKSGQCELAVESFGYGMAQAGIFEMESSWGHSKRQSTGSSFPDSGRALDSISRYCLRPSR